MELPWHKQFADQWRLAVEQQRAPHAVILAGPVGVGKRAAAAWMVNQKLNLVEDELPQYPFDVPSHPDLHWLVPPEDKNSIVIDQVRALVHDLSLTSHSGRGKAAIIDPAHLMTNNAANSLLKTLEEPPGDTLLVLVVDKIGRLPATIFSRCQRIEIRVPDEATGMQWLDRLHPGQAWAEPLSIAGSAPLAAIDVADSMDASTAMARDFVAVATGDASPVRVAEKWSKLDTPFVLSGLTRMVQQVAKACVRQDYSVPGLPIPQSVLQCMDTRNLFCYLDQINRLRGQGKGSYNVVVTLESLLIDWATGLSEVNRDRTPAAMLLQRVGK